MMRTVSIIVPIYNASAHLERCVQSLFVQSLEGIEYVFVDDCSTDGSLHVLKRVIEQYPVKRNQIKIVKHEINKGSAAARNSGLTYATGEYIGWVDADDWISPYMFENMYKAARTSRADVLWSDFFVDDGISERYVNQDCQENSFSCIQFLISGKLMGFLWNKLFKRSLFEQYSIRFIEGLNMAEDLRVCVKLYFYAENIVYFHESHYHYMKSHNGTISHQNTGKSNINHQWVENIVGIIDFLTKHGLSDKLQEEINLLKLSPKKNLLVRGNNLKSYQEWRSIFPESNSYIWKTKMPMHYKILAWFVDKNKWLIVQFWIFLKYRVLNR